ncbi:MAG: hypothetical protein U5L98_12835 [Halomonas sp.]|uniref:hypothetical protein n=1 Tax=Halomonas sp. TaxID=1486246 RepID=UPI002ACD71E8|nr:hypothetical protein [Halomonas sp.]MDZ7853492.1 hypothetical protein [Halomonas sp.]
MIHKTTSLTIILVLTLGTFETARSELMSIKKVQELFNKGREGEIMGTSYSQGVFDGLIGMEGTRRHEGKGGEEFCGIFDAYEQDEPVRHPAYKTEMLIEEWNSRGWDMEAPFIDLALSYLSGKHGC